ncbi:MAG: efflux RND transporter periplasmic adaptor subunit [Bacteroidota bacterium]
MKKTIIRLSVYACLFITACTSDKEKNDEQEKFSVINPVVTDTVYINDYVADIQSLQHVELRARIKGYIEKIYVDEGQAVKEGQILFSISRQEYEEDLSKARAMLKSAIADAKATELDLHNTKTLAEKNIVSKTEVEIAQSKLDALNAKIDEAKSSVASAELSLSYTEIRAPFNGVIDRIPNKTGSLIDEGALLTTLSDNKKVYAYFNVSEKEYLNFTSLDDSERKNDISLILANNQIHNYEGGIEAVGGEINKNTGTITFRACFPNSDFLLKHGASGKVRIKNKIKNALLIPQKSTFEIQENIYVYVVDKNNVVRLRKILPSILLSQLYVVSSGLSANDKFVYEGIQKVKEGDKIEPVTTLVSEFKNH